MLKPNDIPGHRIRYETTGTGESAVSVPVCSCGWAGQGVAAYDDWQQTRLAEQSGDHLRAAHRISGLTDGMPVPNNGQ